MKKLQLSVLRKIVKEADSIDKQLESLRSFIKFINSNSEEFTVSIKITDDKGNDVTIDASDFIVKRMLGKSDNILMILEEICESRIPYLESKFDTIEEDIQGKITFI